MPKLASSPRTRLSARTPILLCIASAAAILFSGCATTTQPDPLEPVNRKMFSFNEGVDKVVLKPVASAYKQVVPAAAQTGISNFFSNLQEPWSSANLMLQGRVGDSASTLARFGTNSTVGVLGLMDVATGWGMPEKKEDFGLTLDTWGVGTGPYMVLPIFGPSNLRDTLASPVDSMGNAKGHIASVSVRNTMTVVQAVSGRAEHLEASRLMDQAALDKYLLLRDLHLKRRNRAHGEGDILAQGRGDSGDGRLPE
ncbi:VacJ family lipoprotein [Acidovorax sp. Leaf73]|uniref:MlaA family lipoprotein n=1 Tax=Acidovorax sp. Leaf73 TaxID=2876566 RepID=UPI001E539DA7|nr:VacJ family lipoprotein [Acidovorax sp. Leaf73]